MNAPSSSSLVCSRAALAHQLLDTHTLAEDLGSYDRTEWALIYGILVGSSFSAEAALIRANKALAAVGLGWLHVYPAEAP